ncbi:GntR family transcriptional regulator [Cupriavidus oxalaticus]|uniref:GntR family transcriptional regulator n=1 Tax=Cupriavidus oxalaticus TaxID=96344 RepID=UPI0040347520
MERLISNNGSDTSPSKRRHMVPLSSKTDMDLNDTLSKGTPLFDQVHDVLWDMICRGDIKPGDRMKDSEWSAKLGLSRTPVREAMRKLQQDGVLLPLTAGGYQVKSVRSTDLAELYTCRAALEALAAEQASRRLNAEAHQQLIDTIHEADLAIEADELDRAFSMNGRFHKEIFLIADNGHLDLLGAMLSRLVLFYRSALLNRVKSDPSLAQSYRARLLIKQKDHKSIVAAMYAGNHALAATLMRDHVLSNIGELESHDE